MRKIKLSIMLFAIIGLSTSLSATECNGSFYYTEENSDYTNAMASAMQNCCAGSTITFVNLDDPNPDTATFNFTVAYDGQNA